MDRTEKALGLIRHAEMANRILNAVSTLCDTGMVDLTAGKPWDYNQFVLMVLVGKIPQMKTVQRVEIEGAVYNGCWARQEVELDFSLFGEDYTGTLAVSRHGPALEDLCWHFEEKQPQPKNG